MTRFEYVNNNLERIRVETKYGLVSSSILRHFEIYCRFDYYRKQGYTVRDAAIYAGEDMRVSDRWVLKIIKQQKESV